MGIGSTAMGAFYLVIAFKSSWAYTLIIDRRYLMRTVWIVLRNGKVDEVFGSREAAQHHSKSLLHKWNLTEVVEKEIKEF